MNKRRGATYLREWKRRNPDKVREWHRVEMNKLRTAGTAEQITKYKARKKAGQHARYYGIKPDGCSVCKEKTGKIEGHHPDYEKPLEIIWACRDCHLNILHK